MIKINQDTLDPYIKGKKKHSAYETTVDIMDHLKFHFEGYVYDDGKNKKKKENPYFARLIDETRPSESSHIKEYRRKIYLPKTKQPCFKIVNSLKKIVKSPDWNINYTKVEKPAQIRDGEQLEDYCEKNLPFFKSVENWFYSYALKEMLSDPNGLVCVLPTEYEVDKTEFRKPYPYFVCSDNVLEYKEDEYAIFKTNKTYEYTDGKETYKDFVICIATKEQIWEVKFRNAKGEYNIIPVLTITFGSMPVFRIGGVFKEIIDNSSIYESFVSAILPGLDAAARESSDLDAEVVQHIFSTMWYYASQGCSHCSGTGKLMQGKQIVTCEKCDGAGVMAKSPYKDLVVKAPEMGEQGIRPPYAGYIEKNTEIVKVQDERISNHKYEALSAINMEFLAETPLNQSGKAKEVDKDELNNFVYGIGYHSVYVINKVYYYINEERVMDLNLTEEVKGKMLPTIPVPERYEMLSEGHLQEQISLAREGKLDPLIIEELESDFVEKKYENYPEVRLKMKAKKHLNPFPMLTLEEKDSGVLAGTILKEDAILSNYIDYFVQTAINEDEKFLNKEFKDQLKIVQTMAQGKIKQAEDAQEAKDKKSQDQLLKQIDAGKSGQPFKGAK